MEWDELHQTGKTWRVRVRLADHPGQLAVLATRLSEHGCNLLGVGVLPVAGDPGDPAANVVDELVLRAPGGLRPGELVTLVEVPGASCVGIVPASVGDLVDAQTAVLRAAAGILSGAATAGDALSQVLDADSVVPAPAGTDADGTDAADGPGSIHLDASAHRATITVRPGQRVVARREWAPFTDGELARVPALLELLSFADGQWAPAPPPESVPAPGPKATRQLSSLDAQFLNAETATTFTHVGGVTVLDPAEVPGGRVTIEALRALMAGRLHLVAPLRWRLHQVPLGLDLPYWVDCGTVELTEHVREVQVPPPGTDAQLGEQVARLAETPLRRDRPLWECYLLSGLAGGRQALYTKVHHAVIDGTSCAEVLAVVCDLTPQPASLGECPDPAAERAPGPADMLRRGARRAVGVPAHLLRSSPALLPHLLDLPGAATLPGAGVLDALAGRVAGLAGLTGLTAAARPPVPPRTPAPPPTPFNGPITAGRDFAFVSLPLADVKAVKNRLGFTVNDVVMALCTSALRQWLLEHEALPDAPLVASIPVSVRTPEQLGAAGNEISFMLAALPTDVADPGRRLEVLHASLAAAKERFRAMPARLLHDYSAVVPQALHGVASRLVLRAARLGAPPFNLFVSNVPGPQVPLYAAGARVTANYPVSVVSEVGGAMNITVMSYDGHLDFGITVCRDLVPDAWAIAGHLRAALTELVAMTEPARV